MVARFTADFDVALAQYPRELIYNMEKTLLEDSKKSLTVTTTINAAGEWLPLRRIFKGSTNRCEEKIRNKLRQEMSYCTCH